MKNLSLSLDALSKEELKELIRINAGNFLALDGTWFQAVEKEEGMDKALYYDREAWRVYTEIEARKLKKFLKLPEYPGLDGLEQALSLRFASFANRETICQRNGNILVYKVVDCRVQSARKRKGMPYHPCKSVGFVEYAYFAKIIDKRIECEALSCYPDVTDNTCACAWKFVQKNNSGDI